MEEIFVCSGCTTPKFRSEFYERKTRGPNQRSVSSRCRKCRSEAYLKAKADGKERYCLRCEEFFVPIGKEQECNICLGRQGLRCCTSCRSVRVLDLDFYAKRSMCRECDDRNDVKAIKRLLQQIEDGQILNLPSDTARLARYAKVKYGLNVQELVSLMERNEGRCEICNRPPAKRRLVIDHDHKTGKVRGMLCHNCNTGLGHMQDSEAVLLNAVNYLQRAKQPLEWGLLSSTSDQNTSDPQDEVGQNQHCK